jgi:hypothetical protein
VPAGIATLAESKKFRPQALNTRLSIRSIPFRLHHRLIARCG